MKRLAVLFLVVSCLIMGQEKKAATMREEFPKTFSSGVPYFKGKFTVRPFSDKDGDTYFAVQSSDEKVDYIVVDVFYILPVRLSPERKPMDLLLHKTVGTAVASGVETLTDPVPIPLSEIHMIRISGLHREGQEEFR